MKKPFALLMLVLLIAASPPGFSQTQQKDQTFTVQATTFDYQAATCEVMVFTEPPDFTIYFTYAEAPPPALKFPITAILVNHYYNAELTDNATNTRLMHDARDWIL